MAADTGVVLEMPERIQKIIAARGIMSRRAAESYIKDGRVTVNGVTAELGGTADEKDVIAIDSKPLLDKPQMLYIMLNKPRGIVTTMSDEQGRRAVAELVQNAGARVLPVGRLDMDSEGLLLLTNDNELINRLTHPSHEVEKEYHVWVRDYMGGESLAALSEPMEIDGRAIYPARVKLLGQEGASARLSVVIHEGRKRQVRKMCALTGLSVDRLMRVREGDIELGGLKSGEWRHLTQAEVEGLRK